SAGGTPVRPSPADHERQSAAGYSCPPTELDSSAFGLSSHTLYYLFGHALLERRSLRFDAFLHRSMEWWTFDAPLEPRNTFSFAAQRQPPVGDLKAQTVVRADAERAAHLRRNRYLTFRRDRRCRIQHRPTPRCHCSQSV